MLVSRSLVTSVFCFSSFLDCCSYTVTRQMIQEIRDHVVVLQFYLSIRPKYVDYSLNNIRTRLRVCVCVYADTRMHIALKPWKGSLATKYNYKWRIGSSRRSVLNVRLFSILILRIHVDQLQLKSDGYLSLALLSVCWKRKGMRKCGDRFKGDRKQVPKYACRDTASGKNCVEEEKRFWNAPQNTFFFFQFLLLLLCGKSEERPTWVHVTFSQIQWNL